MLKQISYLLAGGLALTAVSADAAVVTFRQGENGYTSGLDTSLFRSDDTKKNHNYGASSDLIVAGSGTGSNPIGQALIRFNDIFGDGPGQVPAGSTINSATVTLTGRTDLVGNASTIHKTFWSPMIVDVPNYGNKDDQPASVGEVNFHKRVVNTQGWGSAGTSTTGPVRNQDFTGTGVTVQKNWSLANADPFFNPFTVNLTSQVASWASGATPNYGWIIQPGGGPNDGDQDGGDASYSFIYSNEAAAVGNRPLLTIDYTPVPEPASIGLLGLAGGLLVRRNRQRVA